MTDKYKLALSPQGSAHPTEEGKEDHTRAIHFNIDHGIRQETNMTVERIDIIDYSHARGGTVIDVIPSTLESKTVSPLRDHVDDEINYNSTMRALAPAKPKTKMPDEKDYT